MNVRGLQGSSSGGRYLGRDVLHHQFSILENLPRPAAHGRRLRLLHSVRCRRSDRVSLFVRVPTGDGGYDAAGDRKLFFQKEEAEYAVCMITFVDASSKRNFSSILSYYETIYSQFIGSRTQR